MFSELEQSNIIWESFSWDCHWWWVLKICPHIQPLRSSPRLPLWEAKQNGKLGGGTMSKMIKILISKLCRKREILNFGFFKFNFMGNQYFFMTILLLRLILLERGLPQFFSFWREGGIFHILEREIPQQEDPWKKQWIACIKSE